MIVYDEPRASTHRVIGLAESPDPQRPGWVDPRVVRVACGRIIALTAHPKHKPAHLTVCCE